MQVKQPRVRDNAPTSEDRVFFSPSVLPPYLRRSKSVDELIPWLYLKGISTGDFSEALCRPCWAKTRPISARTSIVRLKEKWSQEYEVWSRRDLSQKHYVYVWADGIYVNVRLEDDANRRQCLLVLMGATSGGEEGADRRQPTVTARVSRVGRSCSSICNNEACRRPPCWPSVMGHSASGLLCERSLATTREQRCWVHKTANVLNKMPKSVQAKAKADLHEIWQAETRKEANQAFDHFLEKYRAKYDAACECLWRRIATCC